MRQDRYAVTGQRESMTPVQLAEEVIKVVGDAEESTAHSALQIAEILLKHRKSAEIEFQRRCISGESD
ncbi:MAG: hypothetical protein ACRD23_05675 [Terriglobales bacterium]